MKKRLLSVLAFALAVSAGAAFVLYQLIASRVNVGAATKQPTKQILVASRDLALGALIAERDITKQDVLVAPAGSILKKEDIIGRGVISQIHQDSPFFDSNLAPKGGGAGFAALIPTGMRAFAVHVSEVAGVAGFAVAGMHVDVLASGSTQGSGGMAETVTRTVLQNIQVLSAGQNYQKDAEGKPVLVQVVNLLVSPKDAEVLNLASEQHVQLSLRNPTDNVIVATPGAALNRLFDGTVTPAARPMPVAITIPRPRPVIKTEEPAAVPVAVPVAPETSRRHVIEVFAGDKRSETVFPAGTARPNAPAVPQPVVPQPVGPQPFAPQQVAPQQVAPQQVGPQPVGPQPVGPQPVGPQQ